MSKGDINMTSLQGRMPDGTTFEDIVEVFGEPQERNVDGIGWHGLIDGYVFAIYSFYKLSARPEVTKGGDWHIGAMDENVGYKVLDYFAGKQTVSPKEFEKKFVLHATDITKIGHWDEPFASIKFKNEVIQIPLTYVHHLLGIVAGSRGGRLEKEDWAFREALTRIEGRMWDVHGGRYQEEIPEFEPEFKFHSPSVKSISDTHPGKICPNCNQEWSGDNTLFHVVSDWNSAVGMTTLIKCHRCGAGWRDVWRQSSVDGKWVYEIISRNIVEKGGRLKEYEPDFKLSAERLKIGDRVIIKPVQGDSLDAVWLAQMRYVGAHGVIVDDTPVGGWIIKFDDDNLNDEEQDEPVNEWTWDDEWLEFALVRDDVINVKEYEPEFKLNTDAEDDAFANTSGYYDRDAPEKKYYGLADCMGVESFFLFTGSDIDKQYLTGLTHRAFGNEQRFPVIFSMIMTDDEADNIKELMDEGRHTEALRVLKRHHSFELVGPSHFRRNINIIPNVRICKKQESSIPESTEAFKLHSPREHVTADGVYYEVLHKRDTDDRTTRFTVRRPGEKIQYTIYKHKRKFGPDKWSEPFTMF